MKLNHRTYIKFAFGTPLTLKMGVKGFQELQQKKKHTYSLFYLQFSQEEGLISIHSEY